MLGFLLGLLFALVPMVLLMPMPNFNGILIDGTGITTALKLIIIIECIFFCQANDWSIVRWDDDFRMSSRFADVYW